MKTVIRAVEICEWCNSLVMLDSWGQLWKLKHNDEWVKIKMPEIEVEDDNSKTARDILEVLGIKYNGIPGNRL